MASTDLSHTSSPSSSSTTSNTDVNNHNNLPTNTTNLNTVNTNKVPNKQLTLLLLHCDRKILLGMKKRGFGAGKVSIYSWISIVCNE